jgi:hypothetical protein
VDGGQLRTSKYVGFLLIGLGILLMVGAAVLPVSPATQRLGPFRVNIRDDSCGPAGRVAVRPNDSECRVAARTRLLSTTGFGLLIVAAGMALFAGGDEPRGSRVLVSPRVKRRSWLRSPGSRRYKPG